MISPDVFDYMSALAEDLTNDRDAWRARADQAEARLAEDCEGQRCTCGGRPVEIGGAEHRPGCGQPEEARDGN